MAINPEKIKRLDKVNQLIELIGSTGRNFFQHKETISYIEVDVRGRNGKALPTNGGTLRQLIEYLVEYIRSGKTLNPFVLEHWRLPDYAGGDVWGYGETNMRAIAGKARELGIV